MIFSSQNSVIVLRNLVKLAQIDQRQFSGSAICYFNARIWTNPRRLQNPNLEKNIPIYEFVKDGQFKRANMLYVCGLGSTGSLGLLRYFNPAKKDEKSLKTKEVISSTFRRLGALSTSDKLVDVACGYGFTLVAGVFKGTGHTALGFGLNTHSQIGYHAPRAGFSLEIIASPSPVFIPTSTPIVKVSCGRSHSLLLNQEGKVFSLGNNSFGQCGRPIVEDEVYLGSKKVHIIDNLPPNVQQIHCGQDHSFMITEDGELYSCGWGADGQTGLGHYNNQHKPVQVKGDLEGVKIIKVSSFADTVLALDSEGNVFGWGNTEYAQFRTLADCKAEQFNVPRRLKLKNIPGKIIDIAAGGTICAIVNDLGHVFVWGFGILGKGPNVDQSSTPTQIPETLFGMNVYNPDVKVEKINASLSSFAAITNQGDLFSWGKNRGHALGHAHTRDQLFPMQVDMNLASVKKISLGVDHTCALVEKVC